ncbi:MAG: anthranilate synthase component I family protein, partial [Microbacterium sp.]
ATPAAPAVAPPPRRASAARVTPEEYAERIGRCRAAIRAGDAYQLCLTTRFEVDGQIDPEQVHAALRASSPSHHGLLVRSGAHALVGASPERFLQAADGIVRTHPIKGTRPRGARPEEDAALRAALLASPKERAENVMIVDLMRNDLAAVCEAGGVSVERLLEVESYASVHQLVSTVAGRIRPGTTVGELLRRAFPAGSMTGAPKLSAMTLLHGIEAGPRGVFAGAAGWVGDDGRLDLAMTIRSVAVHPDGAYVGAGGGITWRSEPDAEVDEVAVKARAPLAALGAALPPGWRTRRVT